MAKRKSNGRSGHTTTAGLDAPRLKSFVERIERLQAEKKDLAADIAEVKTEAKNAGFAPKVLNDVLRLRRMDKAARDEHLGEVERYLTALGDFATTELGAAARSSDSARVMPFPEPPK